MSGKTISFELKTKHLKCNNFACSSWRLDFSVFWSCGHNFRWLLNLHGEKGLHLSLLCANFHCAWIASQGLSLCCKMISGLSFSSHWLAYRSQMYQRGWHHSSVITHWHFYAQRSIRSRKNDLGACRKWDFIFHLIILWSKETFTESYSYTCKVPWFLIRAANFLKGPSED